MMRNFACIHNVYKLIIENKNLHFKASNKAIFTCETSFYTNPNTIHTFIFDVLSLSLILFEIDPITKILSLWALLLIALNQNYDTFMVPLLYLHICCFLCWGKKDFSMRIINMLFLFHIFMYLAYGVHKCEYCAHNVEIMYHIKYKNDLARYPQDAVSCQQ